MLKQEFEGKYVLEAMDDKNYTLARIGVHKKTGARTETVFGYYGSIAAAVREIARRCANEAPDLARWIAEYRRVVADFESCNPEIQ